MNVKPDLLKLKWLIIQFYVRSIRICVLIMLINVDIVREMEFVVLMASAFVISCIKVRNVKPESRVLRRRPMD